LVPSEVYDFVNAIGGEERIKDLAKSDTVNSRR
jgi:hypothetical protein